jgi:predicted nucleotidyltransferase
MDFDQPVASLIPGARGRLLEALARVDAELPINRLAEIAGVGRTRASAILQELAELGLVERRRVGPTTLVRLDRENAAGVLLARLSALRSHVIGQLQEAASELEPQPLSLILFGSLARGTADASSDIDILAVRPSEGDSERWQASLTDFELRARRLTGNRVQVLDYELDDLRRRYSSRQDVPGASFWRSVIEDAVVLTGARLSDILVTPNAAR